MSSTRMTGGTVRMQIGRIVEAVFRSYYGSRLYGVQSRVRESVAYHRLASSLAACGPHFGMQAPITIAQPDHVRVGANVSIASYVHIWGAGGVEIGDRVMIGTHTSISSLTHDYTQPQMYRTQVSMPVRIEDDVWIGSNAVIFPGITIGKGAVVGAGAVVTRDVAPFAIVAGVPARVIGTRPVEVQALTAEEV